MNSNIDSLLNKEIEVLKKLKNFNYTIFEIKITMFSNFINTKVNSIDLPLSSRIICILRNNTVLFPDNFDVILKDDILFIFSKVEDEVKLRELFSLKEPNLN